MSHTLTAVMLMPRGSEELTGALRHLRAQTRREAIQVVVVHTRTSAPVDLGQFAGFGAVTPVAVDALPTVASGLMAALPHATGDIVALVEDHVLLNPTWAEAVLAAHGTPSSAVTPHMVNANPRTATSWANFIASFSEAASIRPPGPVDAGPGHNTSYKRAVLEHYGDELAGLIQSERTFHYRLRREGHVILHEPAARLAHLNISVPYQAVRHALLGGVLFGAYRARRMSLVEKLARTVLAPLVPPLRLWRTARLLAGRWGLMPLTAWAMLPVLLAMHAAGEAVGYWHLVDGIESRYEHFELHRLECLLRDERVSMTG
jgi:hypothetical protein